MTTAHAPGARRVLARDADTPAEEPIADDGWRVRVRQWLLARAIAASARARHLLLAAATAAIDTGIASLQRLRQRAGGAEDPDERRNHDRKRSGKRATMERSGGKPAAEEPVVPKPRRRRAQRPGRLGQGWQLHRGQRRRSVGSHWLHCRPGSQVGCRRRRFSSETGNGRGGEEDLQSDRSRVRCGRFGGRHADSGLKFSARRPIINRKSDASISGFCGAARSTDVKRAYGSVYWRRSIASPQGVGIFQSRCDRSWSCKLAVAADNRSQSPPLSFESIFCAWLVGSNFGCRHDKSAHAPPPVDG